MSASLSYSMSVLKSNAKARAQVLILEPDLAVLDYLRSTLGDQYSLSLFSEEQTLLDRLEQTGDPDLLLLALHANRDPMPLLTHIRCTKPNLPVIVLSCSAELGDLEMVIRLGVRAIVMKPFLGSDVQQAIEEHLAAVTADKDKKAAIADTMREIPLNETHSFVRSSKRMRDLEAQAVLVARADIPLLILGESGTGKEILALYTHKMSSRSSKIFLKVNCAAVPADLLESELFGYEQGAFTGAIKTKPGKFETCTGGTIFLDEIGEMPAILQAKLLQVLQDGTFSRLGSRSPMKVDVRVIAATNINMKEAMANKSFREDLYYRLNGFTLSIPPLRERKEEIPVLSEYFMRKGSKRYGREVLPFSKNLIDALVAHHWPGNLRELENVVNRYLVLGDERAILDELAPPESVETASLGSSSEAPNGAGLKALVRSLKGEAESTAIAQVLEGVGWNRKAAANDLQISYKALLYKIKQYDLSPQNRA
ncbi:sigma-54 dependent transcriptional regulator [Granulicella sp. dw_53]|uniref:sigma-54-dependent transcriptional regulator n=1 Tax=Granulicella sp. dw_53 TaxID=2719792 RepID=UPI001BD3982C|nr:sigma-54 dependent transcriptional regulator [Granulicella sp. dw_53]